jgi:hypothetical protein
LVLAKQEASQAEIVRLHTRVIAQNNYIAHLLGLPPSETSTEEPLE